jgi:hypothetical protein
MPEKMNKNVKTEEKKHIKIFRKKKANGNFHSENEANKFYGEVNSIRNGFKPQTLMIKDKEGNTVSNKEEILQRWSEYYEKHFELQDGTDNDSVEEWTMCVQTAEPCVEQSNDVDIEMAISNLGNR